MIQLEPNCCERGIAVRNRAHVLDADLDELFARLGRETGELLARGTALDYPPGRTAEAAVPV